MENNFVAMIRCFACGQGAEILIHKHFHNIREMHDKMIPGHFCSNCEAFMKAGNTILISVRDGEKKDNPYRTGRICVMTPQGTARMFQGRSPGMAYIEDSLWDQWGLPRQDDDFTDPKDATSGWVAAQCQKCSTWRGVRPEWRDKQQGAIIQARCFTCQPNQAEGYELFPHKLDLYHDQGITAIQGATPQVSEGEAGIQGVSDSISTQSGSMGQSEDPGIGSSNSGVEPAQ